jgi:hypothetical protein
MKEKKKKRSRLGSLVDTAVGYGQEAIINIKENDKLSIKAAGILVGKAASIVAKPAVQLYDGVREGFNQKEATKALVQRLEDETAE